MATKKITAKELRAQSQQELREQIAQLRQDLWQQRMKIQDGALQQTHQLGAARRQIARIHTVLKQQSNKGS